MSTIPESDILNGWHTLGFSTAQGFAIWVFIENGKVQKESKTCWGLKFRPKNRDCRETEWEMKESV